MRGRPRGQRGGETMGDAVRTGGGDGKGDMRETRGAETVEEGRKVESGRRED